MVELFANSEDPDQTPCFAAFDLGLHCLPITLLEVSRLQWVKCYLANSHGSPLAENHPPKISELFITEMN